MCGVDMAKKLFVGNLSFNADEQGLRELFEKHGAVDSVKIITDAQTGRSRGFAFVEMTNGEDADKAIAALNGIEYLTRPLSVSEARPPQQKDRGFGGGGGRGGFGGKRGGGGGFGGRGRDR